jgi:hypothetical protein
MRKVPLFITQHLSRPHTHTSLSVWLKSELTINDLHSDEGEFDEKFTSEWAFLSFSGLF